MMQTELPLSIRAIAPRVGIPFDTIQIDLDNANIDPVFTRVRFNAEDAIVLDQISTSNSLFVQVPIVPLGDDRLDIGISTSTTEDFIIEEDAFSYQRIVIDSVSSTLIFQDSDTLRVYGKHFPEIDPQNYRIYERFETEGNFADLNDHEIIEVKRDRLTLLLSDNIPVSEPYELFLYFGNNGAQFVDMEAGEFFSLGIFQLSSLFEVLVKELSPNQCFLVRTNGFEDRIFISGLAAPKLFSAPEPFENFRRLSGFRVPPGLSPGTYTLTGSNASGVPLKAVKGGSIEVLDIAYCPLQNSISKSSSLSVSIENGVFNTAFCPNLPPEVAFLDPQSGLRFELTLDPLTDINTENEQIIFNVSIPMDIPPNAVYELVFTTQDGYRYIPMDSCTNPTVFITP